MPEKPIFLSVRDLASRWALSIPAAYRAAGRDVPILRIGGAVRIPLQAVENFEKAQLGVAT
jgi:hypothetical protein